MNMQKPKYNEDTCPLFQIFVGYTCGQYKLIFAMWLTDAECRTELRERWFKQMLFRLHIDSIIDEPK